MMAGQIYMAMAGEIVKFGWERHTRRGRSPRMQYLVLTIRYAQRYKSVRNFSVPRRTNLTNKGEWRLKARLPFSARFFTALRG
jgi:hypothetical protein